MHDTPMKDLFFKDERTFSHGCIRLQEPFQFAYSLLRDQEVNPERKFQEVLEKAEETYINLSRKIPVYITIALRSLMSLAKYITGQIFMEEMLLYTWLWLMQEYRFIDRFQKFWIKIV